MKKYVVFAALLGCSNGAGDDLAAAEKALADALADLDAAEKALQDAESARESAEAAVAAAQSAKDAAEAAATAAGAERDDALADLAVCEDDLESCEGDLASANGRAAACESDLASASGQLATCEADFADFVAGAGTCPDDLVTCRESVTVLEGDLDEWALLMEGWEVDELREWLEIWTEDEWRAQCADRAATIMAAWGATDAALSRYPGICFSEDFVKPGDIYRSGDDGKPTMWDWAFYYAFAREAAGIVAYFWLSECVDFPEEC